MDHRSTIRFGQGWTSCPWLLVDVVSKDTSHSVINYNLFYLDPGVRSVTFRGDILTIGTGTGAILFYDLRMSRYMHLNNDTSSSNIVFRTDMGWVVNYSYNLFLLYYILYTNLSETCFCKASDDSPQLMNRYSPAVYTHVIIIWFFFMNKLV